MSYRWHFCDNETNIWVHSYQSLLYWRGSIGLLKNARCAYYIGFVRHNYKKYIWNFLLFFPFLLKKFLLFSNVYIRVTGLKISGNAAEVLIRMILILWSGKKTPNHFKSDPVSNFWVKIVQEDITNCKNKKKNLGRMYVNSGQNDYRILITFEVHAKTSQENL